MYKKAKYNVQREVRRAKSESRQKLENQFLTNKARAVWQSLRNIYLYKEKNRVTNVEDPKFSNKLNEFFNRFDRQNTASVNVSFPVVDSPLPQPFTVEEAEVRHLFRKQNIREAVGPEGVSTATLKHCSRQLSSVFAFIFNRSS